jgi:hypothetical protein
MVVAERTPARAKDLEGTDDPQPIALLDARRGLRVDAGEQPVQAGVAPALGDPLQAPAEVGIARGPREEPAAERAQVQSRPARHDREAPPALDGIDRRPGQTRIVGGRELLVGIHDVDEVMRHFRPLLRAGLGAPDVEPAIHLQAVAGDDLASALAREVQGERALAGSGGPDDRHYGSRCHHRQAVQRRIAKRRMAAPRACWRVTTSVLQGLDDRGLVLGAEGPLDGEELGVEELVEDRPRAGRAAAPPGTC